MQNGPPSRPPIYTIGYWGHERATFFSLLTRHGVNLLIDVRSYPLSRYMPYFSRDALEACLRSWGVAYCYLGRDLGGRRLATGIEDAVSFARGVERVMEAWRRAYRITIMCTEEDPRHCNRAGRVAPALIALGAQVVHIRGDGRLEPHTPAWTDVGLFCPFGEEPR